MPVNRKERVQDIVYRVHSLYVHSCIRQDEGLMCLLLIQVFNFQPNSAYNQSGFNNFIITNSTGSNGLRDLIPFAAVPLFGLVIINQWVPVAQMAYQRSQFGFSPTFNGTILAAGGVTPSGQLTNTAEEYLPIRGTWNLTASNMSIARQLNQVSDSRLRQFLDLSQKI